MKLTFALITLAILQVNANGHAQAISLSVKNMPVERVLANIEKQSGYVFMYSPSIIAGSRAVTIDAHDMPLTRFLQLVCKDQPFRFAVRSKTILLTGRDTKPLSGYSIIDSVSEEKQPIVVKGIVLGDHQKPLNGASIRRSGTSVFAVTDSLGRFTILAEKGETLFITFVGYAPGSWKVNGTEARIQLERAESKLDEVTVINTGYQKIRSNEMVGAVEVVNEQMLNQQVGTNILDRLKGMTNSLQFISKLTTANHNGNPRSVLNMSVRGWSTINGPTDPLIVVDDFPYDGDIDNIDPNNVESIVVLKDAAAAGAWGTRAGNGVIVINTKRGRYNQKTAINLRTSWTLTDKPELGKLPLLSSAEFIDLELAMIPGSSRIDWENYKNAGRGPLAQVLVDRINNKISAADSAAAIDHLKTIDSRKEWDKYIYVNPLQQVHSLSMNGGSSNFNWNLSGSLALDRSRTQATGQRTALSYNNQIKLTPKLELRFGIDYTSAKDKSGAPEFNSVRTTFWGNEKSIPYLQLADEAGNPVGIEKRLTKEVTDTLAGGKLLDYHYYPLTDWKNDYTITRRNSYGVNGFLLYTGIRNLRLEMGMKVQSQSDVNEVTHKEDSYYTRDMINAFSRYNRSSKLLTRPLPLGDIIKFFNTDVSSMALRGKAEYRRDFGNKHQASVAATLDINRFMRKKYGRMLLGYSENPTFQNIVDLNSINAELLPVPGNGNLNTALDAYNVYRLTNIEERTIAMVGTFSYVFNKKYVFHANIRRDGANVLGVNTNDKWKPLWGAGVRWPVHQETFFPFKWMSSFVLRASTGVTGNVDITKTANPVMSSTPGDPFPYGFVGTPPNPNLRWEKSSIWNFGLEFSLFNRIFGNIDYYTKKGRDLYGQILNDITQSPAPSIMGNTSSMDGHGWDLKLTTHNFQGAFNWTSIIMVSTTVSKVVRNDIYINGLSPLNAVSDGSTIFNTTMMFPGQSLFGVTAVKSAGLNAQGYPQFLVKGIPTTDINAVMEDVKANGQNASSFLYFGSADPTYHGTMINTFNWKGFTLSLSVGYKLGYYFKKSTLNNYFLASGASHKDWVKRWQKPGDELITTIPVYDFSDGANNYQIDNYYYSSDLVRRGDHIRFNYIDLNYLVPIKNKGKMLKSLSVQLNIANLGLIWTANKKGLDPETGNGNEYMRYNYPDKRWSLILSAGF